MLNIQSIQDAMKALIEGGYNPVTGGVQGSRVGGPDVAMAAQQQLGGSLQPQLPPDALNEVRNFMRDKSLMAASPYVTHLPGLGDAMSYGQSSQTAQMQDMASSLGMMPASQQGGLPEVAAAAAPAAPVVPRNTQFLQNFFNRGYSPYTQWRSQADAAVNPILDKRGQSNGQG